MAARVFFLFTLGYFLSYFYRSAKAVLAKLEAGRAKTGGLAAGLDDLPLFAAAAQVEEETCDAIRAEVEKLDVDALSPREALDALYKLKALAREG